MDLLSNLMLGFEHAVTLQNLFYCFMGVSVGTLIGVFIMSVLKNGLSSCGLQAPWQTFLTGVVVIGAVLLDIARTKAANRVKKG